VHVLLRIVLHLSTNDLEKQVKAKGDTYGNSGHQDQPPKQVRQEGLELVVKVTVLISIVGHTSFFPKLAGHRLGLGRQKGPLY
jgi:hypothetical protein